MLHGDIVLYLWLLLMKLHRLNAVTSDDDDDDDDDVDGDKS